MNYHSFDVNIATKYSMPVAVVLNHIAFWIQKNKANNKHLYEGRHWTYNSIKAFQEIFPYWSFKQMRTVLDKLKETGLILTGNFNHVTYDQTTWYALSDEGLKLYNMLPPTEPVDNVEPICPNGQIEEPKGANRIAAKGKPIPDNKPDIKTDTKSFCEKDQKKNNPVDKSQTTEKAYSGKGKQAWKAENEKKPAWAEPKKSPFSDPTKQSTSFKPLDSENDKPNAKAIEALMLSLPKHMRPKRFRNTETGVQSESNSS